MQVPLEQISWLPHASPQVEQSVLVPRSAPLGQRQVSPKHTCPVEHAVPHFPQLADVPSPVPPGHRHVPFWHVCPRLQASPHTRQFVSVPKGAPSKQVTAAAGGEVRVRGGCGTRAGG